MRDPSRLRQRALAHRVRGLRGLRRRPAVLRLDRDARRSARRRSSHDDMVAIATVGAHECLRSGITTIGDCSFSGAAAVERRPTGLRAIVYLEVFGRERTALDRFHEGPGADRARCSPTGPARRLAACAVHLHDRGLPRVRRARACRRRRTSPRAPPSGSASGRARATGAGSLSMLVPSRPGRPGSGLLAAEGLLGPSVMAAHACTPTPRRSRLLAATVSAWRTALARTATSAAASRRSTELLARVWRFRDRDRQPRLDAVARPVRGAPDGDRDGARTGRAARCTVIRRGRARARDARWRARARHGRSDRLARARKAGRPDGSLACELSVRPRGRSCYGSRPGRLPDRVTATLVAGEPRYLKGTSRWPDSTRAARSARSRMLP